MNDIGNDTLWTSLARSLLIGCCAPVGWSKPVIKHEGSSRSLSDREKPLQTKDSLGKLLWTEKCSAKQHSFTQNQTLSSSQQNMKEKTATPESSKT